MFKAILTFDYELFLGVDSGTADASLIKPTDMVIELLKRYKAKAIFFVDATYLLCLKKYHHKDYDIIADQLKRIIDIGSSVELHLHPQWLDAIPARENKWRFTRFDHYRLHSLDHNKLSILFEQALQTITYITGIQPRAFRAGGWSIMPFYPLKDIFKKNKIIIDMSVLPGHYKNNLPYHFYDYLNVPDKEYYRFEDDVTVENQLGYFLEIPVTVYSVFGFFIAIDKFLRFIQRDRIFGDGVGLKSANIRGNLIKRLFILNKRDASIEGQSSFLFLLTLRKTLKKKLSTFVMHPNTLSSLALQNLDFLLQRSITLNTDDIIKDYYESSTHYNSPSRQ